MYINMYLYTECLRLNRPNEQFFQYSMAATRILRCNYQLFRKSFNFASSQSNDRLFVNTMSIFFEDI